MVDVPAPAPVTIPVVLPIPAAAVVTLDHVPPGVESVSVVVEPWHNTKVPLIADAAGLTVTVTALLQPVEV